MALTLPNSNAGQPDQQFRGNFEHSKDDMDCVLLFDGSSFRLEALAGRINSVRSVHDSVLFLHLTRRWMAVVSMSMMQSVRG